MIAPGTQPSMSFIFGSFRISELDAEFDADGFDGTTGGTGVGAADGTGGTGTGLGAGTACWGADADADALFIPLMAFSSSSIVAVVARREARMSDISMSVRTLKT